MPAGASADCRTLKPGDDAAFDGVAALVGLDRPVGLLGDQRAVTTSPDTDWMVTVSWAVVENR
jgi:hypothetical protein